MKPVLLLAPPRPGLPLARRLDLWQVTGVEAAGDADYASVIVLNDGSAETIRRLRQAFALREQHKQLPVALLTYLEPPRRDGEGVVDVLADAPARPAAVLAELGPELCVEFRDEVLSLEYQAN